MNFRQLNDANVHRSLSAAVRVLPPWVNCTFASEDIANAGWASRRSESLFGARELRHGLSNQ
eukprot:COSAG03_NODE_577_length_6882_cov_5.570691_4_plen_62_part_00